MGTLKPQSIGTLNIDGWVVTFGAESATPSPLHAVPYVTVHPPTATVPTSYYSMRHSAL